MFLGVAPVLDAIGSNLEKLVLEDFTEVDVDFIGDKCRNLQHLALSAILNYAPMTGKLNNRLVVYVQIHKILNSSSIKQKPSHAGLKL